MIRDEELNRLIRYAQGMGLSVRFKPYVKHSRIQATWTCDGTELVVYVTNQMSKLDKILSLIHELGHHKAWINNDRQPDPEIEEALDKSDNDEAKKRDRKRILDMEAHDSLYWEDIYKDTNCQFNIDKLHKQREFDIWCYEVYYETGREAKKMEKRAKLRELRKKYGC